MQSGDKRTAIDLAPAAGPVAKADDIGATLPQACVEGQSFRMVGEGNEASFAVLVVAHEHGEDAAGLEHVGRVGDRQTITVQEFFQRRGSR